MGIKLGVYQHLHTLGDIKGNLEEVIARISSENADLWVLPELALSGYYPMDLLYRPDFVKDLLEAQWQLLGLAKNIVFGGIAWDGDALWNGVWVGVDGQRFFIPKSKLPSYGPFDEYRHFSMPVGDYPRKFLLGGIRIGVVICEELWRHQSVGDNVDVWLIVNASPFASGKHDMRLTLTRALAVKTSAYAVYVNAVGAFDDLVFDGASFGIDPAGELFFRMPAFEEASRVIEVFSASRFKLQAYRQLKVWSGEAVVGEVGLASGGIADYPQYPDDVIGAIVLGIREYFRISGFGRAVVGVSGGIDSAVVLALAVMALGPDNVLAVTMPSHITSSETLSDAREVARRLGVKLYEIPIAEYFHTMRRGLTTIVGDDSWHVSDENLQARIRGLVLMYLANRLGALVLATGNKSEIAVGYNTLYGDTIGAYAPLKDVYKTQVYQIANRINGLMGSVIPQSIIDRPPTAELREGQLDEERLPPYPLLDEILKFYLEQNMPLSALVERFGDVAIKVARMVEAAEYKRFQMPPGPRVSRRHLTKDRRMPVLKRLNL